MGRRRLQEQTMKDNFLFAAVMLEEDNCRDILSCVLGIEIEHVEVSREKNIVYHPEYHGIRLDVFAKGTDRTHYNVEMQVVKQKLERRSRYYHDQMDMELLTAGTGYEELPDTYVIFICDYDPLGLGKYRYTIEYELEEAPGYHYEDGRHTIFLSTKGKNDSEVPEQLVHLLHFIGASLPESMEEYDDELVRRLQQTVKRIKNDREMGARYMLFEELLNEERSAGRAEGRIEGRAEGKAEAIVLVLSKLGEVPETLKVKLNTITDINELDRLFECALDAERIETFEEAVQNL